jgi:hypothetical protein
MTKTSTWRVKDGCRKCKSPVYYYPAKLLLESKSSVEPPDDTSKRIVSCTCTGENENSKHTLDYLFPTDFVKENN